MMITTSADMITTMTVEVITMTAVIITMIVVIMVAVIIKVIVVTMVAGIFTMIVVIIIMTTDKTHNYKDTKSDLQAHPSLFLFQWRVKFINIWLFLTSILINNIDMNIYIYMFTMKK